MARKKVLRALAGLPRLPRFRAGDHKAGRLLEVMRQAAVLNQKEESQPFYSLREVTQHFHVPLSMVSGVYARLEQDGLLTRIRGSKTLLQGRGACRQLNVQGLVGLPASLACVITFQDYRTFFMRLRRELRMRGYVTEMVHFESPELRGGELSDRLKKYQVDTVIWFLPEIASRDTVARLRDAGVRVIGVSDGGLPGIPCQYQIRRDAAVRQILRSWRLSKEVDRVAVMNVPTRRSAADEEWLQALVDGEGYDAELVNLPAGRPGAFTRSLPERSGIFLQSSAASVLSYRAPELLTELLQTHRVALVDGPVTIPFAHFPAQARVDLVYVDWQAVVERMVNDLVKRDRIGDHPIVFEAEARMRVAPGDYAQSV